MNRKRQKRIAATLIDVAVGSMLMSLLIIPTLHLTVEAQTRNFRLQIREVLLHQANRLMENCKSDLSDKHAFDKAFGSTFATTMKDEMVWKQHESIVSMTTITPDRSVGNGVQLLNIVSTAWHDLNQNGRVDTGEPSEALRTQWASP